MEIWYYNYYLTREENHFIGSGTAWFYDFCFDENEDWCSKMHLKITGKPKDDLAYDCDLNYNEIKSLVEIM